MIGNEAVAFAFTFGQEGDSSISLDYNDPGNWSSGEVGVGALIGTKFGVSAPTLIAWNAALRGAPKVTRAVMAALDLGTATAIIGAKYWNVTGCPQLPSGVDLSVLDHAFNAGDVTSVMLLQRIVEAGADGHCGPLTLEAVDDFDGLGHVEEFGPVMSVFALKAVQAAVGLRGGDVDGLWGPKTEAAVKAKDAAAGELVLSAVLCAALYDAQLADYESIGRPEDIKGWTNRAQARLMAAVALALT